MDRVVVHCRRAGLACVALLSVALGVGAIWVIARPDVIGRLPTTALFGVVGLLVLPGLAAGALMWDRRAVAEASSVRRAESAVPVRFIGDPTSAEDEVESASRGPRPIVATHPAEVSRLDPARHRHLRGGVPAQE